MGWRGRGIHNHVNMTVTFCFSCGATDAEFACSRCRRVRFCDAQCQRDGWKRHKMDCRIAKTMAVPEAPVASPTTEVTEIGRNGINLSAALLRAMHQAPEPPLNLMLYPNVGAQQGEFKI